MISLPAGLVLGAGSGHKDVALWLASPHRQGRRMPLSYLWTVSWDPEEFCHLEDELEDLAILKAAMEHHLTNCLSTTLSRVHSGNRHMCPFIPLSEKVAPGSYPKGPG